MPSGVFVLDIDGPAGAASLRRREAEHGTLPATLTSATGRHLGRHLWFTADVPVPKSEDRVGEKLDIRGDGSYAVVPPSVHPNCSIYRWVNDLPPAPAPAWLVALAQHKPRPIFPAYRPQTRRALLTSTSSESYGLGALNDEISALRAASSGHRNSELNRASFCLHQLVAGQELHAEDVMHGLLGAGHENGLVAEDGLRKVQATIESGGNAELRFPRDRYGRR